MRSRSYVWWVWTLSVFLAPTGADAQTTHYRSIGAAGAYAVGTVAVVNGDAYVVGSLTAQWKSANRGRGDRITIGGTAYTILDVLAENELMLMTPYAGASNPSETYSIERKFSTLRDWERCISGSVACPGVFSSSLPADARIEVGIVYNDGTYVVNTGGEDLKLDSVVTDATHHITLTATPSNRHHGVADTGVVLDNGAQANPAIDIQTGYVTIEWIEIHNGGTTDQILVTGVGGASQVIVRNVIFVDDDRSSHGFHVNDDSARIVFYNNVLYGLNHGVEIAGLTVSSNGSFELYHNTFYQNIKGLNSNGLSSVVNDVIFMSGNLSMSNLGPDYDAPFPHFTSQNNYDEDGTSLNHGGFPTTLANVAFVSEVAPEDLHIQRTSGIIDLGSAVPWATDDLDGGTRDTPDIGADEAMTSSANEVVRMTSKSSNASVLLEWRNPDYGPIERVEIVRDPSIAPSIPADGTVACTVFGPGPLTSSKCADGLSLSNGTTYFYSAFVYDFGGNFSAPMTATATPFDTGVLAPEWRYQTPFTSLDPAGVRALNAYFTSGQVFHGMTGGSGPTGGEWPSAVWAPYELPTTVQHRPVVVDVSGNPTALLAGQDGRVYAVNVDTGKLSWRSPALGGVINAAPAAMLSVWGASGNGADKVYVGTSNLSGNTLYLLDLNTGAIVNQFDDSGQPLNIGAITGIAVTYPAGPVFFVSRTGSGGLPRNVWSIDVTGASPAVAWSDAPGEVVAGPTRYRGNLYVGTASGDLLAYNETGVPSTPLWTVVYGDGPVKSPIFPVWPNDTLLLSTGTSLRSVQVAATGGCASAPCPAWALPFVSAPSPPLVIPGGIHAFVGLGNGTLREITLDIANPMNLPLLNRPFTLSGSVLGAPGFSVLNNVLYVSDSAGTLHGIPLPIP